MQMIEDIFEEWPDAGKRLQKYCEEMLLDAGPAKECDYIEEKP